MPLKLLARVLFPRLPEWQARRQTKQLMAAISVAIILGAAMAAIILLQGAKH